MALMNVLARRLLGWLPNEHFTRLQFLYRLHQWLDLRHPRTFNEKLQWLKLRYRDPLMTLCADKWRVRDYVRESVGEEVLVPLIAVFESAEALDFSKLPERFVLKANHGSGWNVLCRDRAALDEENVRSQFRRWLETNFSQIAREWVYEGIDPRIVCEEFLTTPNGEPPFDYKFFCFHGEPGYVQVDYDRFLEHERALYDMEWNKLPCALEYKLKKEPTPRPAAFERMVELARRLSRPFPFARVDLYELGDRAYFGELTFFPGKGIERFRPREYDAIFGAQLIVPLSKSNG